MVDERELWMAVADAAEKFLATDPIPTGHKSAHLMDVLVERLINLRRYEQNALEPSSVPAKTRPCEFCGTLIFFAKTVNGRWAPMEIDQVPAEGMIPAWKWRVSFDRVAGQRGAPEVRFDPNMSGQVWVDHRQTCGIGDGPKFRVESLVRRWKVNVARAESTTAGVVDSLLKMRRRYASEEWVPNADDVEGGQHGNS